MSFDAVVLAGGSARRLGRDKPEIEVGGARLIDHALAAVAGAATVVVVGPPRRLPPGVVRVREEPPGGGPVAALARAMPELRSSWVVLLAADLPFISLNDVTALTAAAETSAGGAVLVDPDGREQWLAGCFPRAGLGRAVAGMDPAGRPAGAVLGPLVAARVAATGPVWVDCDTEADLERARRLL
jgi:molybdopterin-guanine dinucleotide biosynthesis protein A